VWPWVLTPREQRASESLQPCKMPDLPMHEALGRPLAARAAAAARLWWGGGGQALGRRDFGMTSRGRRGRADRSPRARVLRRRMCRAIRLTMMALGRGSGGEARVLAGR
jgi:hypothetical protein